MYSVKCVILYSKLHTSFNHTVYLTLLIDHDSPCPVAGIYKSVLYLLYLPILSLQNNWPLHCMKPNHRWHNVLHCTRQMSAVRNTCQLKIFMNVAPLRNAFCHVLNVSISCCSESSYFIWKYVISVWAWSLNLLVTECVLGGFKIHNSEMHNDLQYPNKAIELCLPLKYLVYGENISWVFFPFSV